MGIFEKPEITIRESITLILHSVWAIFYHFFSWLKKNWDKVIHLVWAFIFGLVLHITGNYFWGWVAVPPAIIYPILWGIFVKHKGE